jgi:hypothetical protein
MLECSHMPKHKDTPRGTDKEKDHVPSKCKAMEQGIKPVLDLIGIEPKEVPTDRSA